MHRIDTDGATSDGHFTDGNPAVGQEGTIFDAAWLTDMQETIAFVIEHAGIPLVKGDYSQLAAAITEMVAGIVGSGGGAVPTTRKVLGGGLVTGGGTLDVDETLTVAKALAAEIAVGTEAGKAITPDQLAAVFGTGTASNGTIALPGGRILKYFGYDTPISAEGQVVIPFDTPFPTACLRVPSLVAVNASATGNRDIWPQLVSKSKTGLIAYCQWTGVNGTLHTLDGIEGWAIGY